MYFTRTGPGGYPIKCYDLYDKEFHEWASEFLLPVASDLIRIDKEGYNLISITLYQLLVFNTLNLLDDSEKELMLNKLRGKTNCYHFDCQHAAIISSTLLRTLVTGSHVTAEESEDAIRQDERFHIWWKESVNRYVSLHTLAAAEEQVDKNAKYIVEQVLANNGWQLKRKTLTDLYYTVSN